MNLSARVEYACTAVLELASRYEAGRPVPLRQIAGPHAIPTQFLVQILLQLKAAGLVQSIRGAGGGYQLAMPPGSIRLGDVVRAMEGAPATREPTVDAATSPIAAVLQGTWCAFEARQWDFLDGICFEALRQKLPATPEPMYYI